MTKKRTYALIIYAAIIVIILVFLLFFAPDKWFYKKDSNTPETPVLKEEEEVDESIDYETQKNNLTNNIYQYTYNLMDSMTDKTYLYECNGSINKEIETGLCTSPKRVEYNSNTKKDALDNINLDLLNPTYIFNLLKDIKPEKTENDSYTDYKYSLNINDYPTEITIRSGKDSIKEIIISNIYLQYHLKFTNIKA